MLAWNQSFSAIISFCLFGDRKKNAITVEEESVRNEAHVNSSIDEDKSSKFSCLKRSAFSLKHAFLLLLSISPFTFGILSIWVGQEEEIDAYIFFNGNKTLILNATLVSSQESTNNFTTTGPRVLRPYTGYDPADDEIILFTMNLSWTESEDDIENRLSKAKAMIIYEYLTRK